MDYIYVGRIITTHGLKGELKIRSSFTYKQQVFKVNNTLYIGKEKTSHKILNYRPHQDYDMVLLKDISDIDTAIRYKNEPVYIDKNLIKLPENEYLDSDLIGLRAYYNDKEIGTIKNIVNTGGNNNLFLIDKNKYIPKQPNFIKEIDLNKKEIHFKNIEGLL